ncbi:MAG: hypothetical protein J7K61_00230 [Thermoplasmata archaeon]|nr:hypothetical protein [Thermoplasmata archaeon]
MVKYSTVSIPKELHEEIRRTVLADPRFKYRSVAEFSIEAILIRLDEIRRELEKEKRNRKKRLAKIVQDIKKELKL